MSKYEELRLRLNFNMEDPDQVKLYEWLKQYSSAYERNRALMGTLLRALSENVSTEGVSIPDSFLNIESLCNVEVVGNIFDNPGVMMNAGHIK